MDIFNQVKESVSDPAKKETFCSLRGMEALLVRHCRKSSAALAPATIHNTEQNQHHIPYTENQSDGSSARHGRDLETGRGGAGLVADD